MPLRANPSPSMAMGNTSATGCMLKTIVGAFCWLCGRARVGNSIISAGGGERTNRAVVEQLCTILEELLPPQKMWNSEASRAAYSDLITCVPDRPGHDRRYAIDATKIRTQLGWQPRYTFKQGLAQTVRWYVDNRRWCEAIGADRYNRERLGLGAAPLTKDRA